MKVLKPLIFLFLFSSFASKVGAQDLDNLYAILAEGYTIDELHNYTDILTYSNHRSVLEKNGFKFEKHDTQGESYIYKKNDYVSFHVNYSGSKITSVHFVSSPQKFYKAIAEIKGNSKFVKSSEKPSGTGTITYYKFEGHSMSANDNYYRVTMWPKESTAGTTHTSTPSASSNINPTIETYYSAKEIADAMNSNIQSVQIGFSEPNYKFEVKGAMNLDKRSIRFISKANALYVQMNIPRNGECDYGLKEVKAKWTGQTGGSSTSSYFYITFDYLYTCNGKDFKGIYVFFNPSSSFTKPGVEAWVRKNAYN